MARFILIDRASGYIWGDTADFMAGQPTTSYGNDRMDAVSAAVALDTQFGRTSGLYAPCDAHQPEAVYDVYRADVDGSDAVPVVTDGQSQEQIDAVIAKCRYVTSVFRARNPFDPPEDTGIAPRH